jgi:hypothetical protein
MQQAEEEEDQPNFCKPTNNRQGIQSNFLQRNKCKDLNGGQIPILSMLRQRSTTDAAGGASKQVQVQRVSD